MNNNYEYEAIEENKEIQETILKARKEYRKCILKKGFSYEESNENSSELKTKLVNIAFKYLNISEKQIKDKKEWKKSLEKASECLMYSIYCSPNNIDNYYILFIGILFYSSGQYSKSFIILNKFEKNTSLNIMITSFLKKDISTLSNEINKILLEEFKEGEESEDKFYEVILAQSFSYILEFIFTGNKEYLMESQNRIKDLIEFSKLNLEPAQYMILKKLLFLVENYSENSLWNLKDSYEILDNEKYSSWVNGMAFNKKPIMELFISQKEALEKSLSENGAIITLPTSSGKTKIAEITILETLIKDPESLIFYIAPFKTLAHEIEVEFSKSFEPLGYIVTHLYGSSGYYKIDREKIEDANIIIVTPEKLKAMIRSNSFLLEKVKLIVFDEGHLIGVGERNTTSELLLEEIRINISRNKGKFLVLSAVMPNAQLLSKWLTKDENQVQVTDWRPSTQKKGVLSDIIPKEYEIFWIDDNGNFENSELEISKFKKPKARSKLYPSESKEAICLLAIKLAKTGSVMIFIPIKKNILGYAKEIYDTFYKQNENYIWKDSFYWNKYKISCEEIYGKNSEYLKYAEKGIICHHGSLFSEFRIATEELMKSCTPKIIIATSTLSQGVNIGISHVIITSLFRGYNKELKKNIMLTKQEFWNTVGRAGRAFVDIEGTIILRSNDFDLVREYLIDKKIEEIKSGVTQIFEFIYKISKEAQIDFEYLLELISNNDYENKLNADLNIKLEEKFEYIDDTILALKYKHEICEEKLNWESEYFQQSLFFLETNNQKIIDFLTARSHYLSKKIIKNQWKDYLEAGVPLKTSDCIDDNIYPIVDLAKKYLENKSNNLVEVVHEIEKIIHKFPFQKFKKPNFNEEILNEVRRMWLNGLQISIKIENKEVEKIINNYFVFTVPWGVNAIVKRLKHWNFNEESDAIEEIAQLIEYGLPNSLALNIYYLGIKSRIVATKLSKVILDMIFLGDYTKIFIPKLMINENELTIEKSNDILSLEEKILLNPQIFDYLEYNDIKKIIFNEINISYFKEKLDENAMIWFELIKGKVINKKEIEKIDDFKFNNEQINGEEKIFVKEYKKKYYFTSINYGRKVEIKAKNDIILKKIANNHGIFFEYNIKNERWVMKNRNPYIEIVQKD